MTKAQPNLIARSDTMLGVCHALGEDFGINPNLLRLGFAGIVIFNVGLAIAAYLGIGVLVAISRLVHPTGRVAVASASAPVAEPEPASEPLDTQAASVDARDDERMLVAA